MGRAQTAGYGTVPNKMMPNTFTAIALDLTDNTSRAPPPKSHAPQPA